MSEKQNVAAISADPEPLVAAMELPAKHVHQHAGVGENKGMIVTFDPTCPACQDSATGFINKAESAIRINLPLATDDPIVTELIRRVTVFLEEAQVPEWSITVPRVKP